MSGRLSLVATPIGNLGDVTLRALEVLREADVIACEDTRVTRRLCDRHGITTRLSAFHAHNEHRETGRLLQAVRAGRHVALVTDAGTPSISDPGLLLVRAAREAGLPVEVLPGASAVATAVTASGLPAAPFTFVGFLPPRSGARRRALEVLAPLPHTLVFFESPHRVAATLDDLARLLGSRPAALCRELTKMHEEVLVLPLDRLAAEVAGRPRVKGEITLVVGPPSKHAVATADLPALAEHYRQALAGAAGDRKAALKAVAVARGATRREIYAALFADNGGDEGDGDENDDGGDGGSRGSADGST